MQLTPGVLQAMIGEAARAPSAHNVQPARWHIRPDGEVVLLRARDRVLPIADPANHDLRLAMGAAWEGLRIAASRHGWLLSEPELLAERDARFMPVARGILAPGGTVDPLAKYVDQRRSYRGVFPPAPSDGVRAARALSAPDLVVIDDRAAIDRCADLYDEASWSFLKHPAYEAELYRWTRFSARDPNWSRDGLSADCLSLSGVQRVAASIMLRPAMFGLARKAGVARAMVSEMPQIRSAPAILLFTPERSLDDFSVGRRFYRAWLELTAVGLALAPMSALADCAHAAERLMRENAVPSTRRLANVFRAGAPPASGIAQSARLPVEELFLPEGATP